ncbi:GNAT family N-acetyltransferase [Microbulbifer aggregans]|uniref:GNAT family N-acetyltransferase n=1 Tax=Microbulbifer aggregans TaxID=1769779 RepID=UPI001CFD149C|nr:GNAT family N-acetyltransferase [Microbulbifer aggregans]
MHLLRGRCRSHFRAKGAQSKLRLSAALGGNSHLRVMNPKIRYAEPADAQVISFLYQELVQDPKVKVLSERISDLKNDSNTALFVAEFGGSVCATALVSICSDVMYGYQLFAVIENVVVNSEFRGRGVGACLVGSIEEFCMQKDCSKIMLLSSIERTESHKFFEKQGFISSSKLGFVKYRRCFASQGAGA